MKKYIISLIFSFSFLNAEVLNGIALLINDEPITIYDIKSLMEKKNSSKKSVVSELVDKVIYKQEIKKNNISVDVFDIDDYITKLAQSNNMSPLDFKALVRQQQDYEKFKNQIKQQLMHQKLVQKIAQGKLAIATDEDLKIYYENNKNQFKIANKIDVVAYISKDKELLEKLKLNPMMQNKNIVSQQMQFVQNELNSQVKYILNNTRENYFSAIFVQNKSYNMFFVKNKTEVKELKFEDVKEQIFQIVMKKREDAFLKEYFETSKLTANIKVLR